MVLVVGFVVVGGGVGGGGGGFFGGCGVWWCWWWWWLRHLHPLSLFQQDSGIELIFIVLTIF